MIPPPMSLSAPELGAEPPIFEPLRTSVSSSELLYERSLQRFIKEAELEEQELAKRQANLETQTNKKENKIKLVEAENISSDRRMSIPKILINSKDQEDDMKKEMKKSFNRRMSAGITNPQQQYVWAKRRQSLRNQTEFGDLSEKRNRPGISPQDSLEKDKYYLEESNLSSKKYDMMMRERSESEEKEEQDFARIRTRLERERQNGKTPQKEEEYSEESEEEEYLSDEDFSDDDRLRYDTMPPLLQAEEEETYHPRMMNVITSRQNEPFEILTKPAPLPDPNLVPKPILKKPDKPVRKGSNPEPNAPLASPESLTPPKISPPKSLSPKSSPPKSLSLTPPKTPSPPKSLSLTPPKTPSPKSSPPKLLETSPGSSTPPKTLTPPKVSPNRSRTPSPNKTDLSIPATTQSQMISAAEAARNKRNLMRHDSEEEASAVVDYYGSIVQQFSTVKRDNPIYLTRDELRAASERQKERSPQNSDDPYEELLKRYRQTPVLGESDRYYTQEESSANKYQETSYETRKTHYDELAAKYDALSSDEDPPVAPDHKNNNREASPYEQLLKKYHEPVVDEKRHAMTSPSVQETKPYPENQTRTFEQKPRSPEPKSRYQEFQTRKPTTENPSYNTGQHTQHPEQQHYGYQEQQAYYNPEQESLYRYPDVQQRFQDHVRYQEPQSNKRQPSPSPLMRNPLSNDPNNLGPRRVPSPAAYRRPMEVENTESRTRKTSRNRSSSRTRQAQRPSTPSDMKYDTARTPSPRPLTPEQEQMLVEAEINVRNTMDYITDVTMIIVAFWLYLFKDPLLAVPVLLITVYRQVKDNIKNMMPSWITKKKK